MSRHRHHDRPQSGPSQRQLRAGELIRHALVEVLREEEIHDPALKGVSVTVTGVTDIDLADHTDEIIKALNAHAKFLRGALGRHIDMKFTPDLRFRHDESFDAASHMDRLFNDPRVRADIERGDEDEA